MSQTHHDADWLQETEQEHARRSFLKIIAGTLGSLLFLAPFAAGAWPIIGPLFRKKNSEGGPGFDVRVAALDDVPVDGVPRIFAVFGEEHNVWNYEPNVKIGEVILERNVADGAIRAFSTVCPHLGCAVMVVDDAAAEGKPQDAVKVATDDAAQAGAEALGAETQAKPLSPPPYMFRCPCHQSSFLLDGEKAPPEGGKANPSPRGMDHLPPPALTPDGNPNTEQTYVFADADGKKSVYVRYQEYFTGRSEKIAKDL